MPELVISNLSKQFGVTTVLDDVSFTIADGEFFTLLGPSGCGKSTTLNCIAGLEQPTSGLIAVDGKAFVDTKAGTFLETEERNLGMVFQSYALWPHRTVEQNLAFPLQVRKVPRSEQDRLIDDALEKVGLAHLRKRYPHELSGGQQQRVALARALVYSPSVLLLDEPLSNLDAKLREQARAWLKRLQEEVGITTVYVTHDQEEALALSDRIAVMSAGNVLQVGTPTEIYERPAEPEVAAFVGRCNFLAGTVNEVSDGIATVTLAASGDRVRVASRAVASGDEVTVAIRPERIRVEASESGGDNVVRGQVMARAYVGARYEYEVRVGRQLVQVLSNRSDLPQEVALTFGVADAFLYAGSDVVPQEVAELITVA